MKVAIVHDWLTGMRGGEKCLEVFCHMFPDATLFTLLHVKGSVSPTIEGMEIRTSLIQRLPLSKRFYRHYLPLMPAAIEGFSLEDYDLILSSSHCVAKGAIPGPSSLHISYCYTPMRYAWDMREAYLAGMGRVRRAASSLILHYLRLWDQSSSERVDYFVAISEHVASRVRRYYERDSVVIHPPVDTSYFHLGRGKGDYFLMVGALVPYKRVDLAVLAFNEMGLPLKIIGKGPEARRLKSLAQSNVEFLGWVPDEELRDYYAGCRAFVFPGEEDFGIAPLEAQSAGRPVIAYGRGGICDTVIPLEEDGSASKTAAPTGVLFQRQRPEGLIEAVETFLRNEGRFEERKIRENALRFDVKIFKEKIGKFIGSRLE